jgi:hypothetical protein
MARFFASLGLLCSLLCALSFAQQYPNPGLPMFSTQVGSQYDLIDLADGNISLNLPLRAIPAGPMPLSFSLFGASNAYSSNPGDGEQWYVTTPSFNLLASPLGTQLTDYIEADATTCPQGSQTPDTLYTSFGVVDPFGTVHPLSTLITLDSGGCYALPSPLAQPATDGSGYTVAFSSSSSGLPWKYTIYDKFGNNYGSTLMNGSLTSTVTTPDQVAAVTSDFSGNCFSSCTESITDALTSTPIINYQWGATNGVPLVPQPATYGYTNFDGNTINPPYTINYSEYTQVTNFGCSNDQTGLLYQVEC